MYECLNIKNFSPRQFRIVYNLLAFSRFPRLGTKECAPISKGPSTIKLNQFFNYNMEVEKARENQERAALEERQKQDHRRGIQWDEEVIKEHDKERGTRMKVTEPKTPYNYMDIEEVNEEIRTEEVLNDASKELEKVRKKQEFEERRKQHYHGEISYAKQLLQQHKFDEELDEDEKFEDA
ncbi:unnamed protein product [Blepharisma stoltei]|uniref:Uncharacterized protein n=1 Tax=Blepharisma stoltei TaxID=1481888 RepID=A0AAU9JK26_9CILI|nr:unnamed protein product [Blepharisma stoltei]